MRRNSVRFSQTLLAIFVFALLGYWAGRRLKAAEKNAEDYRQIAIDASQAAVEALHIVQKQRPS